jgi:hypothetical protein
MKITYRWSSIGAFGLGDIERDVSEVELQVYEEMAERGQILILKVDDER